MNYPTLKHQKIIKAFTLLKGQSEAASFLRDLMTISELEEFATRFEIATLLWTTTLPYKEIAQKVNTSTTTVTRVNQWLFNEGQGGYRVVLQRMYGKSKQS